MTFLIVGPGIALAHGNHAHHVDEIKRDAPDSAKALAAAIDQINESYKRNVKPIFQRSCFDCHSQSPKLPWYHSIPIVHSLIEDDMKEAKEHLDFTNDFPFQGHGAPKEDLEAIADSVRDKSMPPLRYRIMHWNSGLTDQEQKIVLKWTAESQTLLDGHQ